MLMASDSIASNSTVPIPQPPFSYEVKSFSFLIKRLLDYATAGSLLILGWPFLLLIALGIKLDSPGPILFQQRRIGRFNRPFVIYKFRTMVVGADRGNAEISRQDARITRFGAFLRNTSLDELPQILNILRGEMSLVGPRPTLPNQVERYTERQMLRLRGLPGITNLPAIHGRNQLDWDHRIELDIEYLAHWSLRLEFYILWKTIAVVLRQEGVYGIDGINRGKQ